MTDQTATLGEQPNPNGTKAAGAAAADDGAAKQQADLLAQDLRTAIHRNAALNLAARTLLAALGLAAGTVALLYTRSHGDSLVAALDSDSTAALGRKLLALTMPVTLLIVIAGLAGVAAWTTHSRGMDEMLRSLDTLNRVEREGEVAVSARGLIVAFEDKLQSARRAFTVLLWLGRSTFIICLGLFAVAVGKAVLGTVDVGTVALGGGSLLGAVYSLVRGAPQTITENLAAVVQIQSIVTGCDRQISLLESDAFAALNNAAIPRDQAHELALEDQGRIDTVVAAAVQRIKDCVPARR
jgi:hypothetical protein